MPKTDNRFIFLQQASTHPSSHTSKLVSQVVPIRVIFCHTIVSLEERKTEMSNMMPRIMIRKKRKFKSMNLNRVVEDDAFDEQLFEERSAAVRDTQVC